MASNSEGSCEELGDEISLKISERQAKNFIPLVEDVAEWLSKIFEREISVENIMDELDNGSLICELAEKIQAASVEFCLQRGRQRKEKEYNKPLQEFGNKIHRNAKEESFQARANAANFIGYFCC